MFNREKKIVVTRGAKETISNLDSYRVIETKPITRDASWDLDPLPFSYSCVTWTSCRTLKSGTGGCLSFCQVLGPYFSCLVAVLCFNIWGEA